MTHIVVPRFLIVLITVIGGFWLVEQLFGLVYRMADILLLFGLAWLLKLLLDPLIRRLERAEIPRAVAITIAYLLVVGGLIGGILALTPRITGIAQNIPALVQDIAVRAENGAIWLQRRGVEIDPQALTNQIVGFGGDFGRTVAGRAVSFAQSLLDVIGRTALVITVSVFMSLTAGHMTNVIRPVVPPRWRDEYDAFVQDVNAAYSSYIRGYFYVVALGTIMSALLLLGFRVPNALIWLMAVLVLRLLPFIGGTLADLLLILVFFFQLSLTSGLLAIGLTIVGQVILTNVLMPRVMSRELGINPLLVLFAVLLGAKIYGVAGILFAVPAAAIIATVTGKAVNRFLLPVYNRPGWWHADETIVEPVPVASGSTTLDRPATIGGRASTPPVASATPHVQERS